MPSTHSPLQEEALRQALLLKNEINEYQHLFGYADMLQNAPHIGMVGKPPGFYNEDAWNVSHQTLDGDFDLDPILARAVVARIVGNIMDGGWLADYLNHQPGKDAGFGEYAKEAAYGPENLVGNLNQGRAGVEAAAAEMKMNNAVKAVQSGQVQSVKLNNNMTLYNANSGKGPPRLRIRISGLQTKVVTPLVDPQMLKANPHALRSQKSGSLSVKANALKNPGGLAGMTGKTRILNSRLAGGVMTFAPTIAVDFYRNCNGKHFNGRQFVIDEFANQSGNLAGVIATAGVGFIAIAIGGTAAAASAPVILIGLVAGIAVQVLWNYLGGGDWARRQGTDIVDNLPTLDFRLISP